MAAEAQIIDGLVARGMPLHVARGITANMIVESRLDPGINEIAPLVEGSRGGYGLNQWTGPRRRQFESFAADRGAPLNDLQTQLDFTLWELQNTERNAAQALLGAQDEETAARIYSDKFLRPGIPHLDRRVGEARRLAGGEYRPGEEQAPQNALLGATAAPQQPQNPAANALARFGQRPQQNFLNAADFQTPQNQLAYVGFDQVRV